MTPISEARHQANTQNAQSSTGPRTIEGKARSAANSRKHGLCAKDLIIAPADLEEFKEIQNGYLNDLQPQGAVEQTIFEQLIAAAWNLRRVQRLQSQLCADVDPLEALDDDALQTKLDRLTRHETRIERSYYRALKELKAIQTERVYRENLPDSESLDGLSTIVSTMEIVKRNQSGAKAQAKDQTDPMHDYIFGPMPGEPPAEAA